MRRVMLSAFFFWQSVSMSKTSSASSPLAPCTVSRRTVLGLTVSGVVWLLPLRMARTHW